MLLLQEAFLDVIFSKNHNRNSNFTGDKGFHILFLLSDDMLFIIENILSKGADVPGVGLYWLIQCITGTFCWTDRDAGTNPSNRDCPG